MDQVRMLRILVVFLLSIFGTHARYLVNNGRIVSFKRLTAEYVIGCFAGLTTFYIVNSINLINGDLELFCISLSSFCARDILDIFSSEYIRRMKRFVTRKKP